MITVLMIGTNYSVLGSVAKSLHDTLSEGHVRDGEGARHGKVMDVP